MKLKGTKADLEKQLSEAMAAAAVASVASGGGPEDEASLVAQIADIEQQKQQAAEDEQFDLALELKQKKSALEARLAACRAGGGGGGGSSSAASSSNAGADKEKLQNELNQLKADKAEALEVEDFQKAASLRK